jgi:hypothetical protein
MLFVSVSQKRTTVQCNPERMMGGRYQMAHMCALQFAPHLCDASCERDERALELRHRPVIAQLTGDVTEPTITTAVSRSDVNLSCKPHTFHLQHLFTFTNYLHVFNNSNNNEIIQQQMDRWVYRSIPGDILCVYIYAMKMEPFSWRI